ncbi:protein S100-A9-like [Elgaria multicarinata webbii]|uniref:protein S100-A9-like n=1 Tax=Elgaria multicarinata webbii TaxID=159646 RepID=UPI002FCD026C
MKTQLEKALECVVDIYHRYCILDPQDDFLQFKEFRKLMKEQAQPFIKDTKPSNLDEEAYIKQLFQQADTDQNNCLKFTEFLYVFGEALNDTHNRSHDLGEDHGHSHGPPGHSHGHGPHSSRQ